MNSRGVYIRVGSTKRVASYDEITRMVKMRYAHEYETRLCNRDDLTFDYLKKRLNEKGIELVIKGEKPLVSTKNEEELESLCFQIVISLK